jgi:hypothetical protein
VRVEQKRLCATSRGLQQFFCWLLEVPRHDTALRRGLTLPTYLERGSKSNCMSLQYLIRIVRYGTLKSVFYSQHD